MKRTVCVVVRRVDVPTGPNSTRCIDELIGIYESEDDVPMRYRPQMYGRYLMREEEVRENL